MVGTSVSFLPTPYLLLRRRPASTSFHPPHGLVQPCVMCRYRRCVASPAAGRPKTQAQNHRVPYSLHAMLRNKAHFAILKVIGDRFPEMTTRSSLWRVSDSVPFCLPFSVIHASCT